MVQYNKNLINNRKIGLSNKLTGGSFFSDLHFGWKLIIIGLAIGVIKLCILSFFKLKINGLVFPIIFGYLGYQLYNTLSIHMKEIGLSLTNNNNKNSSKIGDIITNWKNIIYSLPLLVPKIPRIPVPTFNYQPFEGLRDGIQSLKVPIDIEGESFRLSINFPKLEIPFIDPLAGICCVWEKMEKLLAVVDKAIEPPKKIVHKIFGVIKKLCNFVKEVLIMRNIRVITKIVGIATYPVIGMFTVVLKFLDFIEAFDDDVMYLEKKAINKIIDKLNGFSSGDFVGGNINNNEICLKEIFYKIHLLDFEEKIDKKSDNIIRKLSIYQIYKIQNSEKEGLIKYVNKCKKNKFDKFMKKKILKYKLDSSKFNFEKKYNTPETNKMINEMKKTIEDIKKTTYEGYNLDDIRKYKNVINNKDTNKYNNWNDQIRRNGIQYGGNPFSDMLDALNPIKIIKKAIAKIPRMANIICYIIEFILDKVKIMTDIIGKIQQLIFSKIPVFVNKIKALVKFVNDIAAWFTNVVIKKGIGIINAAIDLLNKIGDALPDWLSDAIFKPIKLIFEIIIAFLKLPFAEFFYAIVDILTNIPKFFKKVTDTVMGVCTTITEAMDDVLKAILEPFEILYKRAKAIYEEFKKMMGFGGGSSIMVSSGLEKILFKNHNELTSLIYTYENLPSHKMNDNYMDKLEKLIKEKNKKIKKIHKLLIKYNKNKQLLIKN